MIDLFIAIDTVSGGAIHPEPVDAVRQKKRYRLLDSSTVQTRGLVGVHSRVSSWNLFAYILFGRATERKNRRKVPNERIRRAVSGAVIARTGIPRMLGLFPAVFSGGLSRGNPPNFRSGKAGTFGYTC